VIDIGKASDTLSEVLKKYNFKNLNDLFPDSNTTTEFMCRTIHRDLCKILKAQTDFNGALKVTLHESHKAWASYSNYI